MIVDKKILLTFLSLFFFLNGVYAQFSVGVDFGITNNQLNITSIDTALKTKERQGYILGVNLNYRLGKLLLLELIPGFLEKKYSWVNVSGILNEVNNTYLQFPINLKFCFFSKKRINLSMSLGGYYAYWLRSEIEGNAPNVFEINSDAKENDIVKLERIKYMHKFDSIYDNRLEFGISSKAELEYHIIKNVFLSIKFHYYKSLTDQQYHTNEIESTRYNQTNAFTAGLVYLIKK